MSFWQRLWALSSNEAMDITQLALPASAHLLGLGIVATPIQPVNNNVIDLAAYFTPANKPLPSVNTRTKS